MKNLLARNHTQKALDTDLGESKEEKKHRRDAEGAETRRVFFLCALYRVGRAERRARKRINKSLRSHISAVKNVVKKTRIYDPVIQRHEATLGGFGRFDTQLLHTGPERRAVHAEERGCALGTGEHPARALQRPQDMTALGFLQRLE